MATQREQIEAHSIVVADTGDLDAIERYRPVDATTNPSLLLAVADDARFRSRLDDARALAREVGGADDPGVVADCFATIMGRTLTGLIPGVVSTEVDARLSFDTRATVERARRLAALYRELDVDPGRYLIKVAGTWEGIRAVDVLETEGLRCNVTLVFSPTQALAAAEAGATLLSPFVGRILDWYVRHQGLEVNTPEDDPGVASVRAIHQQLRGRGFDTIIMGASFRNTGQIEALTGCDRLTISPKLLEELDASEAPVQSLLESVQPATTPADRALNEAEFRWRLNEDPMATDLLADGIRRFARDQETLERLLSGEAPDA